MLRRQLRRFPKVVREDLHHQFLHYMCEIFQRMPDDVFFEEMDPLHKLWWYESWLAKKEIEIKKDKYLGILIGSFSNPEAAQKMIKAENPDYEVSEEDFDKLSKQIKEDNIKSLISDEKQKNKKRRRKKRKLIRE